MGTVKVKVWLNEFNGNIAKRKEIMHLVYLGV